MACVVVVLTDVDDAVVGELPAGLQPENGQALGLLVGEEAQRGVRDVVRLQRELVERGQQLRHGAHRLVRDVDAVRERERDETRRQAGPQPRLRDLIAARQLQLEQRLGWGPVHTYIILATKSHDRI